MSGNNLAASAPGAAITCFGKARTSVPGNPLTSDEIRKYNDFFKASLYLCLGMIYLRENPLLQESLEKEHLKLRLLGHFGSAPGQVFTWMHMNRLIKNHDLNVVFISGPGHGAPAVLSQSWLEGVYEEVYPTMTRGLEGLQRFFKQFSFPGGIGSHATPETPGSLHEGGELGYSISHAFGAVFDNPSLIALTIVGDGESETGPLATSWHSTKFLNPITDGAVLPVLHLNGYKINNPTVLSRISHEELEALFVGYGWRPYFVEGDDINSMHQAMASTMEHCVDEIRKFQQECRETGKAVRPRWPMIILRTPKGWTAPRKLDQHYLSGFWRSHQVPITDPLTNHDHLKLLESWMQSYEPGRLLANGCISDELRELCPDGPRRMSGNPVANGGGELYKPLDMPDFRNYAIPVKASARNLGGSMANFAGFLRDVIKANPTSFRLFGPDETESNKLGRVYESGKKVWMGEYLLEDEDGGNLAHEGRVMEILSEHTCEGWLEGYVLTGRHGLLNSYEPFVHIIDSMVNQHCKWLEKCLEVEWRAKVPSLNILLTAVVWRQDHNGFSHQDPGFLDVIVNKSPEVVRIYLPPDGNCLLSVMDHCLRSTNYVNVVVADKQDHLQYLDMPAAIDHCTKGIGIWPHFSTDNGTESPSQATEKADPDLIMASCGDISTHEAIAAVDLLLQYLPNLRIRFINVVDLFKLITPQVHPHGLSDVEWITLFTANQPVIFNFHSYPWLVHRLIFHRANSHNIHVRGYNEKGNIDTPLELAIRNRTDRFSLAMDAIDNIKKELGAAGAIAKQALLESRTKAKAYSFENGEDPQEITNWRWPESRKTGKA
ncbi:hypothetical protein Cpir12675_001562 [Ceratocystis pirilliformis]|uniref:Phosphoketolase n=1 Tax=Ceratocystis pirilliformis TaxID=259994 RepID=A0ABR3ZHH4_9PEZI